MKDVMVGWLPKAPSLFFILRGVLAIALAAGCALVFDSDSPASASSAGFTVLTHNVDGLFFWAGSDSIVFRAARNGAPPNGIFRAVPSTGAITDLWQHSSAGVAMPSGAAVSPDGEHVVVQPFDFHTAQALSVYRRPPTILVDSPAGQIDVFEAVWRPDSQRVAYVNNWADEVATIASTGGTPNVLLPMEDHRESAVVSYRDDGTLIVISGPSGPYLDGTLLRIEEGGSTTSLATNVIAAATSPDGSTVVYLTDDGTLHSIPSGGGTPVSLGSFDFESNTEFVEFSPDGTQVTVGGIDFGSNSTTFIVPLDGSEIVPLPNVLGAAWAPDGSRLVGDVVDGGRTSLVSFAPDGSELQIIASRACYSPTFSPDGRRIACLQQSSKGNALAVVTVVPPSISAGGFGPTQGPPGTTVTIKGSGFTGATAVRFNGVDASSFTVDSPRQITAVVPADAYSGSISITAPGGTVTTRQLFTMTSEVDLVTCVTLGTAEVPAGTKPIFMAAWHMLDATYLPAFLHSAKTSLRILGHGRSTRPWDKVGRSDGSGGWVSDWSQDSGSVLTWPNDAMYVGFHVVATKTFSNGFATYDAGQELFPGSSPENCQITAG